MTTSRRFRRLAALAVALALLTTAVLSVMAQAEESKFTLIEGTEAGDTLSAREIAAKCRIGLLERGGKLCIDEDLLLNT